MRKKLLAAAGAMTLATAGITLSALPANAQTEYPLTVNALAPTQSPVLDWAVVNESVTICDNPELLLSGPDGEIPASDHVTIDDSDREGTLDLTGIPGGNYDFIIQCEEARFSVFLQFASFTLTKEVEGDAPEGAKFPFEVTSEDIENYEHNFSIELAAGESATFYNFVANVWYAEETDDLGAEEVRGNNVEIDTYDPGNYSAVVTNVFPTEEPVDPDPEPVDPEPEPEPTPEAPEQKPDPQPEPEPAAPIKREPAYTG